MASTGISDLPCTAGGPSITHRAPNGQGESGVDGALHVGVSALLSLEIDAEKGLQEVNGLIRETHIEKRQFLTLGPSAWPGPSTMRTALGGDTAEGGGIRFRMGVTFAIQ